MLRPDAYGDDEVARIKAGGSYETLYQQCVGAEEERIRPEHFGRFAGYEVPHRIAIVLSVDASQCSGPKTALASYRPGGDSGPTITCSINGVVSATTRNYGTHTDFFADVTSSAALIERAANGYALIRDSKRRLRRLRVVEIATDRRSKIARLAPHLETIRMGHVKLPRDGAFVDDYLAEFTASKRATFDQVDATAQYLEWIPTQPPLIPAAPRTVAVDTIRAGRLVRIHACAPMSSCQSSAAKLETLLKCVG